MFKLLQLCRLCVNYEDVSLTLNNVDSDNLTLLDKLNFIAPGILYTHNKLADGICTKCSMQLNETYKFIQNCIRSQETFKQYVDQMENEECSTKRNNSENEEINYNNISAKDETHTEKTNDASMNYNTESVLIKQENITACNIDSDLTQEMSFEFKPFHIDFETSTSLDSAKISSETDHLCVNTEKILNDESNSDILNTKSVFIKQENISECNNDPDLAQQMNLEFKSFHTDFETTTSLDSAKISSKIDHLCVNTEKILNDKSNSDTVNRQLHAQTIQQNICKICKKEFRYHSGLTKHVRMHTGEKPYKCKLCEKAFAHSNNLIVHIRCHTNEKPYQCKTCGKEFAHWSTLTKHNRIHSNDRPFQCKICAKSFAHTTNLTIHIRSHTGEKPFACTLCEKAFITSSKLKRHAQTHQLKNKKTTTIHTQNI